MATSRLKSKPQSRAKEERFIITSAKVFTVLRAASVVIAVLVLLGGSVIYGIKHAPPPACTPELEALGKPCTRETASEKSAQTQSQARQVVQAPPTLARVGIHSFPIGNEFETKINVGGRPYTFLRHDQRVRLEAWITRMNGKQEMCTYPPGQVTMGNSGIARYIYLRAPDLKHNQNVTITMEIRATSLPDLDDFPPADCTRIFSQ